MAFEQAYQRMMEQAMECGSEERRRKLMEHGPAEKALVEQIWWPVVGSLEHLHPEYELQDLQGGTRFVDLAYLPPLPYRLALEADGFGPHARDVNRWRFADNLRRQNHLLIDGWHLLRFSFDDITEKPRRCQQTLLMGLAKWGGITRHAAELSLDVYERALLHVMQEIWGEVTPTIAAEKLGLNTKTAIKHLKKLVEKGLLKTEISSTGRIMRYRLASSNWDPTSQRSSRSSKA
ncbi:winged helix-turn-helix domain-containing protein [Paenibacillus silvisoli]|uniref:winged helix-turn-helix domain-containing protein n=1 Tax=Paenibacillus silvisoli TaxID=3110539 RepID=UPI00280455EA|nr:winged helix-turn-helix domain-containing protein [Paenibacillus silvisoli]